LTGSKNAENCPRLMPNVSQEDEKSLEYRIMFCSTTQTYTLRKHHPIRERGSGTQNFEEIHIKKRSE
jgi:hypothetical protein